MRHACHWPGCERQIPRKLLMCESHWKRLPQPIRSRIWATYRDGQEHNLGLITQAYVDAVRIAIGWAREQQRRAA